MSTFTNANMIQNSILEFHTDKMPFELFHKHFGILKIQMEKTIALTDPLYIYCNIDISDSMNDFSGHAKQSKINYVKKTMQMLLSYLCENAVSEIWVQVVLFNNSINVLIPFQKISFENIENLKDLIDSIQSQGCTNIEAALEKTKDIMESSIQMNPTYKHLHIFLTDGYPTEGNGNINDLSNLVSQLYPNLFIGYGYDHNSQLLKKCTENNLSNSYQFVDNFEMTGQVYAEMLYSILFTTIENPHITVENGEIYDAITDEWKRELYLPNWISEKEYIYHIRSETMDDAKIQIYGFDNELLDEIERLPDLVDDNDFVEPNNLDKYIFKQRTMELLTHMLSVINNDELDNSESIIQERKKMNEFYKKMRKYMREHNLIDDPFMKVLCEDIVISYRCANTPFSEMHTLARRNAQATQSLYRSGSYNTRRYARIHPVIMEEPTQITRTRSTINYNRELFIDTQSFDLHLQETQYPIQYEEDDIETYNDDFVTQNIYSPPGLERMARHISS